MKICDLTQFYSPVSGGVKRYISEKIAWMRRARQDDRHVLIIPGEQNACRDDGLARTYTIRSPLVSRTARYRALLNLTAVEEILEKERPDVIESGDPYQVAWKALASGDALGIPVVAFYHSHFPEAYLRTIDKFFGHIAVDITRDIARRYVRELYNRFAATIVPSPALARLLQDWGVRNTRLGELGVDTALFHAKADPDETRKVRAALDIADDQILLLYVGRLAPEKNVTTLFGSFAQLDAARFALVVVGDGSERRHLARLREHNDSVHWLPIRETDGNSRVSTARPIFSSTPACKKPSVSSRSKVRPRARRSSASAAVTWTASSSPTRNIGRQKIPLTPWPRPSASWPGAIWRPKDGRPRRACTSFTDGTASSNAFSGFTPRWPAGKKF